MRQGVPCLDSDGNTLFESEKCVLCGGCADVCPESCLHLVSLDRLEGDQALRETLDRCTASESGAPAEPYSAIIKDETVCIRCGLCAQRCPVDAITMERMHLFSHWSLEPIAAGSAEEV